MPYHKRYNYNHGGPNQRNQNQNQHVDVKKETTQSPSKQGPPSGNNNSAKSRPPAQNVMPPQQEHSADSEVEAVKSSEKKFTQRSRLFVGNMPLDMTEQQFKDLFSKYGEISETFINANKGFGFVRLDTRANAEKAKSDLDGHTIRNRAIRVRFASHGAALNIKHLSPYVSNELLEQAFTRFGPVERAVVIVDDRGKPVGRAIVEFARKSSATKALQQITEGCFLLTSSPQAIVVKPLEQEDTEDGMSEKNIPKNQQYAQEREGPPRFAQPGTFEYEFAMRWKALDEMERQQQEQLDKSIASARKKLESEMENAIHEHRTMLMKQELMRKQEELTRLEDQRKRELDRKRQLEYAREDQHKKELEAMAQRQEILRAKVEGTYAQGGGDQGRGSRPPGFGGNAMMQEALALEMMAGGQGGLGPAPNTQPHSAKSCPFIASNLRKIIGNTSLIRSEEKFYNLAFQYESTDKEKRCKRNDSSALEPCLYKFLPHCPPMNMCQSLNEWKFQMLTSKINRMFARKSLKMPEHILYFLPIGPFPEFIHDYKDQFLNRSLFQLMGDFIGAFFPGSTVHHLPEINISEISPRNRHHSLTGKLQYLVSDMLNFLRKKLPPDGFAIIGLSWYDMYPCEDMNFILGQGSSQYSACVSSFGRFDPNYVKGFKGQKDGILPEEMKDITEINADILWKIMKVLSHETCHVFGLSHCTVFECLMNASSSTHEALSQPFYLCPLCMSKIQHLQISLRTNCKPDESTVKGHFSSILNFMRTVFTPADLTNSQKIADLVTWLDSMVNYLKE